MPDETSFLAEKTPLSWSQKTQHALQPHGLFLGEGQNAIEVAVAKSDALPNQTALQDVWSKRQGGRATPVLLVVLYRGAAALCGPLGEQPPTYANLNPRQVEGLCREALIQPNRHAALRFLQQALPSLDTDIPGIRNEGLVAQHELLHGTPNSSQWNHAMRRARETSGKRGQQLIEALGFQLERLDNLTHLLRKGDQKTALAVMLKESESAEAGEERFNDLSPVSYALSKADNERLDWVVMVQGSRIRLYSTNVDTGVGRRGRTETYVECQPPLLADDHLPYLWLLFSAEALVNEGSLYDILDRSHRFAGQLAMRLRERVYDEVVPTLAKGIAEARLLKNPSTEELKQTYEMALTVLFRLLFIAYAEDRDLLPYRYSEAYRRRSLKQKAKELADCIANRIDIAQGNSHWQEVSLLWQAVAVGNREWGVPAYDGGLFSDDWRISSSGADLAKIELPNAIFEHALRALLVIDTAEGVPGPIDFRSLGVREFGTIYEGLLESELALAATDLALDRKNCYAPAKPKQQVVVFKGEIYLHNRSGVRKSSGSYYTKPFAVEHLLNCALEPSLAEHFSRLNDMNDTEAAEAFFDFRVADIAMGSGHFLVAAIDRIEKGMAGYLAERDLPGVRKELVQLKNIAKEAVGEFGDTASIENSQLLRRMIARRCIYGIDLNELAVQLARLAVWIHTFVPGLPLSLLDHALVRGNSLVGVGTMEELKGAFEAETGSLLMVDADSLLGQAKKFLSRLANINDGTLEGIAAERKTRRAAAEAIEPARFLCDIITLKAIKQETKISELSFDLWEQRKANSKTDKILHEARRENNERDALHFPVVFPEVFLRDRPGFDVIIGNPPWQEATIEEHAFWARHFPGLRGLTAPNREAEQKRLRMERPDLVRHYKAEVIETGKLREALLSGSYPGMTTGDPDLYKAFCWRFWHLCVHEDGRIGVVLPRSALSAKGSTEFRKTTFSHCASFSADMLLNRGGWVFDDAEHRYTIGLMCIVRGRPEKKPIRLRGPFASHASFQEGIARPATEFDRYHVLAWNDAASLPLLPVPDSANVFAQIRKAPRLDRNITGTVEGGGYRLARSSRPGVGCHTAEEIHGVRPSRTEWRARPVTELHATQQKHLMLFADTRPAEDYWPVYKGESFDIWNPDTGIYYAWAEPQSVIEWIQKKRMRAAKSRRDSAHKELLGKSLGNNDSPTAYLEDVSTLPCFAPRVAFRDVTNRTNQRTIIASLVPPKVFLTNKGPYFLWPRGNEKDQAFLLGVLCSIPLDWYARRFVELNVNFFIINPFPIPRPPRTDIRWQRITNIAGRLACPDDRFAEWADKVGVSFGPLEIDHKQDMMHELDAIVACLYGLDEAQLIHVFETFHEGWNYQERLNSVLNHFRSWKERS